MIHLSRPPAPDYLRSLEVDALRNSVRPFYSRAEQTRRQERMEFPLFPKKGFATLLEHLLAITHNKCAYCESPVEADGAPLDRYRPKAGAIGLDGDFSTEHYWWLAYEWENLYPACQKCNKFKGPKFPVKGPRAPAGAVGHELNVEKRLLIDPFEDEPATHLSFQADGTVKALTEMGEVSISTLELNRFDLVAARQRVARAAKRALAGADLPKDPIERAELLRGWLSSRVRGRRSQRLLVLLDPAASWSAAARAVLDQWSSPSIPASKMHASIGAPEFGSTRKQRRLMVKAHSLRSQRLTRIAILNFKGIASLDLSINIEPGRGAPWTTLLGENGTGKSSLLHAVVLALLDTKAVNGLLPRPKTVLRKGTARGWVKIWLDEGSEPRVLTFSKGARTFRRSGPTFSAILLGYGATRLLPKRSRSTPRSRARVESMFDPFYPLIDANRWLGQLDAESFDYVARALKDVLDLPKASRLQRIRSRTSPGVRLKLFGTELSLDELSDGYQSVLGLTCDIISSLEASTKGALDGAEGLVMLDELGAHLHPRWRMRIVDSLRKAFPRIQFLASTHDPLCLRGLENGEAVVLRRGKRGRVFSVPELPPIKGLHVDQLLTSEYFGLSSTLDPSVERRYNELYRLLAIRVPSETQLARIAELQAALEAYRLPGETRRERRLLQIIDRELAQLDVEPDAAERQAIRESSDRMVAALNAQLAPRAQS